jgi:starch phosphorylase
MIIDKQNILREIAENAADGMSAKELHRIIGNAVMSRLSPAMRQAENKRANTRQALYLSIEFLMGRAVQNNLAALGIEADVRALVDYGKLEEIEDAALGNGGLGRLAACFLDSAAALNLPLSGCGIRYKYGLFKQRFADGFQCERQDEWIFGDDVWSVRREDESVLITFGAGNDSLSVNAVPYDTPIIGYRGEGLSNLRLWQAEAVKDFDFAAFDKGEYLAAVSQEVYAGDISRCLYPNEKTAGGNALRLRQEAFFTYATIKSALREHKRKGRDPKDFALWYAVQLNDTHPSMAILALMEALMDGEGFSFEAALSVAQNTFAYTNHTIMAEALEKWDTALVRQILPRAYEIALQISEHFNHKLYGEGIPLEDISELRIIDKNKLHMARLDCYVSHRINGVAEIHTEILKNDPAALNVWYRLYPEKFTNKTNGITQRRWLYLCNPELSALITKLLGSDEWLTDLNQLAKLKPYAQDDDVIRQFMAIKQQKKLQLADYIKTNERIEINPDWLFDAQIKRIHEYKRQLLNAFSILWLYYGIISGEIDESEIVPTVFIFGGKSAPGYLRAKGIIKYVNEIADLVRSNPKTRHLLKVVFVQDYRVSYAEKIIPAAEISEQISTAGTEASGTGNMKLMLNGAVTLGTFDGANIEIVREAGEENNYIFGARVEDIEKLKPDYCPRAIMGKDSRTAKVISSLIDGTVNDGGFLGESGENIFRELYFALLDGTDWHKPDHYFLLTDLPAYVQRRMELYADYNADQLGFYRKCWLNMCSAGFFSSDRTVGDYAEEIWKISSIDGTK